MIVQHEDPNVGPADYKRFINKLLVTDIFSTFQGEGPSAGWPAIFVRLAGCNRGEKSHMGCQFCDTRFHFAEGEVLPYDQISYRMKEVLGSVHAFSWPLIVLTGGEPMIQDNIVGFIEYLVERSPDITIEIESNGDRLAKGFFSSEACQTSTTLIVSPKVTKAGYRKLNGDVFDRAEVLKFVISWDPSSPYHNIPEWAGQGEHQVWLSPMTVYKRAVTKDEVPNMWNPDLIDHGMTALNYQRAAALAEGHGYLLSMQKHLFFGIP